MNSNWRCDCAAQALAASPVNGLVEASDERGPEEAAEPAAAANACPTGAHHFPAISHVCLCKAIKPLSCAETCVTGICQCTHPLSDAQSSEQVFTHH